MSVNVCVCRFSGERCISQAIYEWQWEWVSGEGHCEYRLFLAAPEFVPLRAICVWMFAPEYFFVMQILTRQCIARAMFLRRFSVIFMEIMCAVPNRRGDVPACRAQRSALASLQSIQARWHPRPTRGYGIGPNEATERSKARHAAVRPTADWPPRYVPRGATRGQSTTSIQSFDGARPPNSLSRYHCCGCGRPHGPRWRRSHPTPCGTATPRSVRSRRLPDRPALRHSYRPEPGGT